jgi:hypothetical protein
METKNVSNQTPKPAGGECGDDAAGTASTTDALILIR